MELPREWEAIVNQHQCGSGCYTVQYAVERCYALHCKPQRELTDAEIQREWAKDGGYDNRPLTPIGIGAVRRIIDLHQRKQREPEAVKLRLQTYLRSDGQFVALVDCEAANEMWTLVDSREIEVTLP